MYKKNESSNKKILIIIVGIIIVLIASYGIIKIMSNKEQINDTKNKAIKKTISTTSTSSNDIYDVILFWGQSNMVGYTGMNVCDKKIDETQKDVRIKQYDGEVNFSKYSNIDIDIIENYTAMNHVDIDFKKNTVYDYSYLNDSLVEINKNTKTVGEKIGVTVENGKPKFTKFTSGRYSIQASYGTNMIPYFAKKHYENTGHKVIVVSAANGGEEIAHFLPHNRVLQLSKDPEEYKKHQYIYEMMIEKYNSAIKYLNNHSMNIGNKFYVVFQGEADVSRASENKTTKERYISTFKEVHNNLKNTLGTEYGIIVEASARTGKASSKPVEIIHNAQEYLIKNNKDIILGSSYSYDHFIPKTYEEYLKKNPKATEAEYKNAITRALLGTSITDCADNRIHFTSAALSQIGKDSAQNAIKFMKNKKAKIVFYKNDGSNNVVTQTFNYGDFNNKFGYNTDGTAKWGTSGQFGKWNRPGYTLLGWSKSKNATQKEYYPYNRVLNSWLVSALPTLNLYAVWSPNTYKITLDNQDENITNSVIYQKYNTGWYSDSNTNKKITNIIIPKRNGYKFGGYYTKPNGTGTQVITSEGKINSKTETLFTTAATLYANWI